MGKTNLVVGPKRNSVEEAPIDQCPASPRGCAHRIELPRIYGPQEEMAPKRAQQAAQKGSVPRQSQGGVRPKKSSGKGSWNPKGRPAVDKATPKRTGNQTPRVWQSPRGAQTVFPQESQMLGKLGRTRRAHTLGVPMANRMPVIHKVIKSGPQDLPVS